MADTNNIKVYLRCRPLKNGEHESAIKCDSFDNEIHEPSGKTHSFDQVFTKQATQEEVYNTVARPLINYVLNGSNCTVFAYGPTGTGKTHTMEGDPTTESGPGIIPRAVVEIFEKLHTRSGLFSVNVSFVELYNEEVYDLLSGLDDTTKLRIYEDVQRKNSVKIEGLNETVIESASKIYDILEQGSIKRQKAATLLNAHSSRSHSIFSVAVLTRDADDENYRKVGKLNLVDLAGSENIARSGAQNKNAREAGSINQSLLTLARVITALVKRQEHIPYRESKLTRILQDSLGGSTRTAMIATISPAETDLSNTLSTIDYASRARLITNRVNVPTRKTGSLDDSEREKLIQAHAEELSKLEIRIRNEVAEDYKRELMKKEEQLQNYKDQLQEQSKAEIELLKQENEFCKRELESKNEQLQTYKDQFQEKSKLEITRIKQEFESRKHELETRLEQSKIELLSCKEELNKMTEEVESQKTRSQEQSRGEVESLLAEMNGLKQELQSTQERLKLVEKLYDAQTKTLEEKSAQLESQMATPPKKRSTAVKRVPKLAAANENDYANLTFDADDEIVMISAKKRHQALTKKDTCQQLTLSGRKKNLAPTGGDIEVSPTSPPRRVTRSRVTRKKLAF